MKKLSSFLLMAVVCAVAVLGVFMGAKTIEAYGAAPQATKSQVQIHSVENTVSYHTPPVSSSEKVSSAQSVQAQSAGASGNVLGAVKEKFISPYSAALSYNNVYMRNKTSLDIDIKTELEQKLQFTIKKNEGPQVLIVHTHTTESYMNEDRDYYTDTDYSRSTDETLNMIAVGEIFMQQLTNAGIPALHEKTMHDYPSYTGSYSRSEKTIKAALQKYPSIKVVVDIHRDAIMANNTDKTKPIAEINGKKAAQVMLVMGCQDGSVTGFENWRQNFRLALKYQQIMEVMYPGLARPLVISAKKYNENLTTGSMLLEIGTDANSLQEAFLSAEYSGAALAALLNTII